MPVSEDYLVYVVEQLRPLGTVVSKRMFGGVGLYHDGLFFGLIDDDMLYFKVDDQNRADYEARGRGPFRPFAHKPDYTMSYYEVPGDVMENPEELAGWAEKALAAAAAGPKKGKTGAKKTATKKTGAKKRVTK